VVLVLVGELAQLQRDEDFAHTVELLRKYEQVPERSADHLVA
jgi:hypothetical protein